MNDEEFLEMHKKFDEIEKRGSFYDMALNLIKAGFEIEFEDESDRSSTHCEFIATHKKSKRKYSVEAKSRHRPGFLGHPGELIQAYDKTRLRIGNLINEEQASCNYQYIAVFRSVPFP